MLSLCPSLHLYLYLYICIYVHLTLPLSLSPSLSLGLLQVYTQEASSRALACVMLLIGYYIHTYLFNAMILFQFFYRASHNNLSLLIRRKNFFPVFLSFSFSCGDVHFIESDLLVKYRNPTGTFFLLSLLSYNILSIEFGILYSLRVTGHRIVPYSIVSPTICHFI